MVMLSTPKRLRLWTHTHRQKPSSQGTSGPHPSKKKATRRSAEYLWAGHLCKLHSSDWTVGPFFLVSIFMVVLHMICIYGSMFSSISHGNETLFLGFFRHKNPDVLPSKFHLAHSRIQQLGFELGQIGLELVRSVVCLKWWKEKTIMIHWPVKSQYLMHAVSERPLFAVKASANPIPLSRSIKIPWLR